jgi:hypothetical protein
LLRSDGDTVNHICTFCILVIITSAWRWPEYRPKHVVENTVWIKYIINIEVRLFVIYMYTIRRISSYSLQLSFLTHASLPENKFGLPDVVDYQLFRCPFLRHSYSVICVYIYVSMVVWQFTSKTCNLGYLFSKVTKCDFSLSFCLPLQLTVTIVHIYEYFRFHIPCSTNFVRRVASVS